LDDKELKGFINEKRWASKPILLIGSLPGYYLFFNDRGIEITVIRNSKKAASVD